MFVKSLKHLKIYSESYKNQILHGRTPEIDNESLHLIENDRC